LQNQLFFGYLNVENYIRQASKDMIGNDEAFSGQNRG